MKTQILKSILVLAMMFFTLPMVAQDYLTIYLKNGHEERHLLSLVKNISSSKYDLDGTLHSDYQIQQVCMEDTIISYLIEDIDSVSFRKVNVEQVAEDVEDVVSTINTILDNSSSPDFQDIANEVANMDGVEEVELDDDALIIKIKDWRNIIYYKTPNLAGPTENMMARSISPLIRKSKSAAAVNNSVKVAITNQFINDEERDIVDEKNNELVNDFKSLGYDVDYITDVNFDFLYSKMFEYDIVMLETHGKFALGRHWLLTNYEIDESVLGGLGGLIHIIKDGLAYFKEDIDDVSYYCIDETRNGKKKWIYYAAVSEDYISKSISKFNNGAIIFASVCSSIKTTQDLANLYFKKGASVYLGYDDEAYYGWTVGPNYFRDMLYGKSAIKAYHNIPEYYRVESNTREKAKLQILTKDKDNESLFITKTVTAPSTEIKDEILDNGSHQITITGYTSSLGTEILCGLEISEDPNMKDVQSDFRTMKEVDSPNGNYTFEMSLTAPSGITLYYRAYSYDGENYNYGEICSYIIPDNLQISTTLLSLKVRETSTIQIIAGSGQYGVTNLNSEIAIATLQGTTISINGVSMGKAQVVVTDILTGQKAIIEITVKDPNQAGQIMMERRYLVNTVNDYYNNSFYNPERFSYQESVINLSNGIYIAVRYHNANYWEGTYDKSHLGVFLAVGTNESTEEEWYISPLVKNEWISEKIVIDCDGTIQYYMNGINMGTHQFSQLDLENVNSLTLSFNPYGWWYTHYHYMDDFKISTPATTISDSFDDGVINPDIWKQPANPDGVREEDGIMKTEQLRTDKDFVLRSKLIPIFDSDTNVGGLVKEVEGANYRLYKKLLDSNDVHVNADGWRFFRTQLLLDVTKDSKKKTYEVGELYMPDDDDVAMCMLFDLNNRKAIVFANSKTSAKNYSMDGYAYVSSLDNLSFTKETVFSSQNWGWMPYFVDSGNQQYILKHFSFNGYYQMQSKRSTDGTWTNGKLGSMSPDQSQKNWEASDRMLVVGSTPTY